MGTEELEAPSCAVGTRRLAIPSLAFATGHTTCSPEIESFSETGSSPFDLPTENLEEARMHLAAGIPLRVQFLVAASLGFTLNLSGAPVDRDRPNAATVGLPLEARSGPGERPVATAKRLEAVPNRWMSLGPDGGGIYSLATAPSAPSTVWAGTSAGAFKSTDGGAHWTRMWSSPDIAYLVAVHPMDSATVFLVDRNRHIYKSTDGGTTWGLSSGGIAAGSFSGGQFAFKPDDANVVYFRHGAGVYKSADSGATWAPIDSGLPAPYTFAIAVDPARPNRLYRASYDDGVLRSEDGGATWTPKNTGLPSVTSGSSTSRRLVGFAADPANALKLFAFTSVSPGRGLYVSTDGGETWGLQYADSYSVGIIDLRNLQVAVRGGAATVYGVGLDPAYPSQRLFKSVDEGVSWASASDALWGGSVSAVGIAADPARTLYAAIGGELWKTTDSGGSWTIASSGLHAAEISDIAFDPAVPSTWYVHAYAKGILKTTDGGSTFISVNQNIADPANGSVVVDPNDSRNLLATGATSAGYDWEPFYHYLVRSTDGGLTWHQVADASPPLDDYSPGLQAWAMVALPTTPTTFLVAGITEGVYKSSDAGTTFAPKNTGLPADCWLLDLAAADDAGSTLFVAVDGGSSPGVYRSTNGGETWSLASTGLPAAASARAVAVHRRAPSRVFALVASGASRALYVSANGGDSWDLVSGGLPASGGLALAIAPSNPNTIVMAGFAENAVWLSRSVDGGNTWTALTADGLDLSLVFELEIDPANSNRIIAGGRGGLSEITLAGGNPSETLRVAKSGSGTGSVASNPGGISCGSACTFDFTHGAVVTLTAVPDAGSTFTGWSGGACSGTGTCAVTMSSAQAVTATFALAPVLPQITSFTATPSVRTSAGASTLAWTTTGATSVAISGLGGTFALSGTRDVSVAATTTYTLTATNAAGSVTATATVNVLPGAGTSLGTPVITDPSAGQVVAVAGVGFTWNAVASAAGYDVKLYSSTTGATVFAGSLVGNASTNTLVTLPDGAYLFAVRACNASGFANSNCGAFATRSFSVTKTSPTGAPTVTAPAQGAVLTASTQTFSWTSVAKVDPGLSLSYEVLLTDVAGGNIPDLQITVPDPTLSTIYTLHSSALYELKVRACQAGCGPWSTPVTFSVDLPEVPATAPSVPTCSVSGGNSLTCSWSAVSGADVYSFYVVQPTGGPGGGALTVAARLVSTTTVTLPVPQGFANVIVAACTGDGCGPYSGAQGINPAGPNPSSPNLGTPLAASVVNGPGVEFSWNRIPGDDGTNTWYRLYVQDLSRQAAALDVYTRDNFYAAYFKAEGARYDALVVANPGASQVVGPAIGFNVRGLSASAPTMVSPPHQSQVQAGNLQLGWSPVPGATLYQYWVAVLGQGTPAVTGVTPGLVVQVPLPAVNGQPTTYSGITRACMSPTGCSPTSDTGWGPWSNAPAGPGVTNFTVVP
ncbi:MAG: InlB B-repeat-containing protein [Thermoanaerobaculia bacterium]